MQYAKCSICKIVIDTKFDGYQSFFLQIYQFIYLFFLWLNSWILESITITITFTITIQNWYFDQYFLGKAGKEKDHFTFHKYLGICFSFRLWQLHVRIRPPQQQFLTLRKCQLRSFWGWVSMFKHQAASFLCLWNLRSAASFSSPRRQTPHLFVPTNWTVRWLSKDLWPLLRLTPAVTSSQKFNVIQSMCLERRQRANCRDLSTFLLLLDPLWGCLLLL